MSQKRERERSLLYVLLSADVLLLLRLARHFADANSILNVPELQAQVLASDGQHGTPLSGSRLWIQLKGEEKDKTMRLEQVSASIWSLIYWGKQLQFIIRNIMRVRRRKVYLSHYGQLGPHAGLAESHICYLITGDEK